MAYEDVDFQGYDEQDYYDDYYNNEVGPSVPTFDEYGNDMYESEEDRKRREREEERLADKQERKDANEVVGSEEVQRYADGSQTIKTTQEVPAADALRPRAPKPVSPEEIFNRQIQTESGGRHRDANGNLTTSPKGAKGIAQIMDDTGRDPGYGIKPASPGELASEKGNREFGARYKEGMLKEFKGDQIKATAAYNAGPGAVKAAEKLAQTNGGSFLQYLPKETQQYVGKVMSGIKNAVESLIPSAAAGELPRTAGQGGVATPGYIPEQQRTQRPQPVTPEQQAQQEQQRALRQIQEGAGQQTPVDYSLVQDKNSTQSQHIQQYQAKQDDPRALMALGYDKDAPEWLRDRSRNRAADLITQKREMGEAQAKLANASETDIAKYLKEKTTGGSYAKMLLWAALGAKGKAEQESDKLGIGTDKMVTSSDGTPALIKMGRGGTPIEGYNAKTGEKLSPKDLVAFAAGGTASKWQTSAEFFEDKKGQVYQTQHNDKGQTRVVNVQTNEVYKGSEPLKRQRDISALGKMNQEQTFKRENMKTQFTNQISKLKADQRMSAFKNWNSALVSEGLPPLSMAEMGLNNDGTIIGEVAAQPTQMPVDPVKQQAPVQQRPGPVAPDQEPEQQVIQGPRFQGAGAGRGAIQPVAPTMMEPQPSSAPQPQRQQLQPVAPGAVNQRPPLSQIESGKTAKKEEAEVVGKDIGTIRTNQPKAEQNADYLITKIDQLVNHPGFEYSVGVADVLGGVPIPFGGAMAKRLPGTDTSDFHARLDEVQGQSFLIAIENLRGMGALSNLEGQTATKAIQRMNVAQSEKEFKTAATDFQNIIKRGIDRNRDRLGQEPLYGVKPESVTAKPSKPLSKEDSRAIEWARNNPNDPRAAEIKKRLGL